MAGGAVGVLVMVVAWTPTSGASAVGLRVRAGGQAAMNPRSQPDLSIAALPEAAPLDFMSGGNDVGTAAHWPVCTAITWTLDPMNIVASGARPSREIARWQSAIDAIATVSGYAFVYIPTVAGAAAHPQDMGIPMVTGTDVVISYESETDQGGYQRSSLRNPRTVAETSLEWFDSGTGPKISILASISMDYADLSKLRKVGKYRVADRIALMIHELGHVMGLGHTSDRNSIMFTEWMGGSSRFSSEDVDQLRALAQQPCSN
jgi:hypothetical protein